MAKRSSQSRYYSPPSPCPTEPPDAPNGWWLYLSPVWHGYIQGLVKLLENRKLWIGADAEIDDVIGWVQDIEVGSIHVSDMVLDVRISNGRLEKLVGGMWVDAGAIDDFDVSADTLPAGQPATVDFTDNVITFGIPEGEQGLQGFPGEQGLQGIPGQDGASGSAGGLWSIPEARTDDMYCKAATMMADVFADRLQDNLELIDFTTTVLAQTADSVLDFLGGIVPFAVPSIDAIVEFSFEAITEPIIDFARENVWDIQARALARNQIYCAMRETEDFTGFWNEIDWLGALPSRDFDLTDPYTIIWNNLDDWLSWLANTANGTNAGWLILAFGAFVTATVDHLTDSERSAESVAAYAMNTASYRDNADCSSADCQEDWVHVFEFENSLDGWDSIDAPEPTTHRYTLNSTYLSAPAFVVGGSPPYYRALGTLRKTFAATILTEVTLEYAQERSSVPASTDNQFLKVGTQNKVLIPDSSGITNVGWGGLHNCTQIDILQYVATHGSNPSLGGFAQLHSVTVKGKGTNPFE